MLLLRFCCAAPQFYSKKKKSELLQHGGVSTFLLRSAILFLDFFFLVKFNNDKQKDKNIFQTLSFRDAGSFFFYARVGGSVKNIYVELNSF